MFLFLTCLLFCLDSYLTLPLDFGVYHCEYHYYLLLVLQGTVGAQKIGVVRNTMQVFCNFRQVYHCQKLSKSAEVRQSYCKNKKGAVFLKHSVHSAAVVKIIMPVPFLSLKEKHLQNYVNVVKF